MQINETNISKLFNKVLNMMTYIDGQNNYVQNTLIIHIYSDCIEVESACCNDYGSVWGNDDLQTIGREELAEWYDFICDLNEEDNKTLYHLDNCFRISNDGYIF